ncbi:hypothetical protein Dacet_1145 [Denitrovibrio acetiphilus DSM 12809]|uniref:Uncharacterized protein n=1 Tax=Denitrovibrio acetiphilus (strain DSM 12809 / NBRC 114555 / N2460) TaxID=522772 RepID=D4H7B8_DENA2|nr:hypothetical protein Dacet_1145 [Denitrovibrio acetiphilus DSM 12809]
MSVYIENIPVIGKGIFHISKIIIMAGLSVKYTQRNKHSNIFNINRYTYLFFSRKTPANIIAVAA